MRSLSTYGAALESVAILKVFVYEVCFEALLIDKVGNGTMRRGED